MCEVVQTLQLCTDRDPQDIVGDLSVCLDGLQVDEEALASAEKEPGMEHLLMQNPKKEMYSFRTTNQKKIVAFVSFHLGLAAVLPKSVFSSKFCFDLLSMIIIPGLLESTD